MGGVALRFRCLFGSLTSSWYGMDAFLLAVGCLDVLLGLLFSWDSSSEYPEPPRESSCIEGIMSSGSALALELARFDRLRGVSEGARDCWDGSMVSCDSTGSELSSSVLSLPCSTTQDAPSRGLLLCRDVGLNVVAITI